MVIEYLNNNKMVNPAFLPGKMRMKRKIHQKATADVIDNESFFANARGAGIMAYRGICQQEHLSFNEGYVTAETFEAHLAFYKKHFNVLSINDYYNHNFNTSRFNICLTFDDGLANNYACALPLLEKYQVPATFFLTAIRFAGYNILWNDFLSIFSKYGPAEIKFKNTLYIKNYQDKYISTTTGKDIGNVLKEKRFDDKAEMMEALYPLFPFREMKSLEEFWLQMTTEQIKLLSSSPLATIGSHGLYHNDLGKIHLAYARNELVISKRYLEDIIDKKITSLAFPYGSYTREVVAAAREAGYTQLLCTHPENGKDVDEPTIRGRHNVSTDIDIKDRMRSIIMGCK